MRYANRAQGVFTPPELRSMKLELERGNVAGETPAERSERATAILERWEKRHLRKPVEEVPPELGAPF